MSELAICLKARSSDRIIVREVSCKFQSVSAGHKENIVRNISLQLGMRYKHWMYGFKHKSATSTSPWKLRILNSHYSLLLKYKFSTDSCFSSLWINFCHAYWSQWFHRKEKANIILLQILSPRNYCDNHMLSSQLRGIMIVDIRIILWIHLNIL